MKKTILFCAFVFAFYAIPAFAQNVEVIGTYDDWTAYAFSEKSGKVCYMASIPKKDEGKYTRRGDIFAIVTHRPGENSFDVVSIVSGYTFQTGSSAKLQIGRDSFNLFTENDTAWASNAETDAKLVKSMLNGSRMVVKGASSRGTETVDTYSLIGFTNAYNAINTACNRKK